MLKHREMFLFVPDDNTPQPNQGSEVRSAVGTSLHWQALAPRKVQSDPVVGRATCSMEKSTVGDLKYARRKHLNLVSRADNGPSVAFHICVRYRDTFYGKDASLSSVCLIRRTSTFPRAAERLQAKGTVHRKMCSRPGRSQTV